MALPTVSASRGRPATVTGSLKATAARITSPAIQVPPAPCGGPPERVRPVTEASALTAKAPSAAMAWAPRPSAAGLPAASRMVPPFSESAEAPTLTPSGSESPLATR